MDPTLLVLLQSWEFRPDVMLVLVSAGTVYTLGWWRLRNLPGRRQHKQDKLATSWRLVAYLGGLFVLSLGLLSPIDSLGSQLFSMHMVQHLLLMMIAPPLLLLADPFPFILWGLPAKIRQKVGRLFNQQSAFRHRLRAWTSPGIVWIVFVATYIGWHDPNAYDLSLRNALAHDLQHLTFVSTALLFWWHVTAASPHIHRRFPYMARIAYVLVSVPPNVLTGVAIAFATQPLYPHYTTVPRLWGLTVMQDQMLAGGIMWIPGSMMYIVAAIVLIARLLQAEEKQAVLSQTNYRPVGIPE